MDILLQIFSPSYLLFPALLGSAILGLVCPLVGAYLILRRTIFLGLTLPQVAGAGVAFAFWVSQSGLLPFAASERVLGMAGSLLFTFGALLVLAYLERKGKGTAEGRLAATYALAGAFIIIFIVFNPVGEIEILSLLKGEVISLSKGELKLLIGVFGFVMAGMLLFRRDFLLSSFDRDLAFLLNQGNTRWDFLFYLLAGLTIGVGVIMAGPLLIFGFLVLPPLAAKPLVRGMVSFLCLSSLLGVLMSVAGFYLSVRLDVPLGPMDVAVGCAMVFLAHLGRAVTVRAFAPAVALVWIALTFAGCAANAPRPFPNDIKESPLWLPKPSNSTNLNLTLPSNNPLRSLAEMAGKSSPETRETVMDLLRESLQKQLAERGFGISLPERTDKRLASFSFSTDAAVSAARQAKLTGALFLADILRWNVDSKQFVSVVADFKLVRIADGAVLWETRYQRAVPTPSATNVGQASGDAVREIIRELFKS
ncbi:MAG: metal ABC transporter permease [Candidatus Binatia bacterium]